MKNKKIALIAPGYVGPPLTVEFGKKREVDSAYAAVIPKWVAAIIKQR